MRLCRDPPNATWCVSSIDLATSRLPPAARSTRGTNHGCRLPHTPSPEERASVPGPRFALRRWQEGLNRNDPRTNCYRRDGGQQAFLEQRAFVELLASNQPPSPKFRGGLYNQVHASWRHWHIRAIFYVNDTLTAKSKVSSPREAEHRLGRALKVAAQAYRFARMAQKVFNHAPPVLQFEFNAEGGAQAALDAIRFRTALHGAGMLTKRVAKLSASANPMATTPFIPAACT